MRKVLSVLLACSLLLLCACGKQPQDADKPQDTITGNYKAAVAAIHSGDYRTAYDLLQNATDEPSKELLARFVFVPTSTASVIRGEDYEMHFSTVITYDDKGNPLTYVHTDKGNVAETVYTYTDGKLTQEVMRQDDYRRTITYAYDAAGQLTRKHIAAEDTYQGNARLDESTYTYAYDTKSNLIEEKRVSVYSNGSEEVTTTYRYNEANQTTLKKTVFASGSWNEETTEYRTDGTLYKVTERLSSTDKAYVDEYDDQERLWKEWVIEADGYAYASRTYHYNDQDLVTQIDRYPAAVNFAGTVTYEYDDKGNLLCETEGPQKTTYTYDADGNCLTEARTGSVRDWSKQYTYDEKGNCLTDAITYDGGVTESTANTYDADGNRIGQAYEGYSSETGSAITITETVEWTLFYYPDEIPELVEEELYNLTIPPNAA